jgi:hypothetical protein
MNKFMKYTAAAAALTGALALAAATPSEARNGRNAAAIGGFAAGAIIGGAVAAGAANGGYYNGGYYGEPAYVDSGYGYGPAYAEPGYAYAPAPVYRYRNNYRPQCAIDMGYGKLDYSGC